VTHPGLDLEALPVSERGERLEPGFELVRITGER
jgi:hypothetical protein